MLTYKEEDDPLPSEETNVPHEELAPQPSDEVASSTHEAPAPPPLPTKLDTDDLLVGNLSTLYLVYMAVKLSYQVHFPFQSNDPCFWVNNSGVEYGYTRCSCDRGKQCFGSSYSSFWSAFLGTLLLY